MEAERRYETKRGTVTMRRERPDDAAFLLALFAGHAARSLRPSGLPEDAITKLVAFQHRSATVTHRSMFPDAIYSIIESGGVPIGRLIEQDEGDAVYFVDFALLPERQAKGLGTAFIEMVADEWGRRGRAARVEVLVNNEPSLKLCRKLGFALTKSLPSGYIVLRREPRTDREGSA
jgi:ribosomal protein S18 acetylase RimI-like enzyme